MYRKEEWKGSNFAKERTKRLSQPVIKNQYQVLNNADGMYN